MITGNLRHRITIQTLTEGRDAVGGVTETWAAFASRYANVTPLGGRELHTGAERTGETTHQITLRYLAGITRKHRILYGSRVFDIIEVANQQERNRWTVITAKERD